MEHEAPQGPEADPFVKLGHPRFDREFCLVSDDHWSGRRRRLVGPNRWSQRSFQASKNRRAVRRPTLKGKWPALNGRRPALNGRRPTLNGKRPTLNGKRPTLNGKRPTLNGKRP